MKTSLNYGERITKYGLVVSWEDRESDNVWKTEQEKQEKSGKCEKNILTC